jgi:hypothetical protein
MSDVRCISRRTPQKRIAEFSALKEQSDLPPR